MSRLPPKSQMSETLRKALSGPPRMVKARNTKLLEPFTEAKLIEVEQLANRAEKVGAMLAEARQAQGLNQREAAKRMKRNHSRIAALEHPKPEVALLSFVQYAEALGYSVTLKLEADDGRKTLESRI
jgi:ribosome-binding protein aMBF1 (putative translation factor)